jgi:hypothetical protein
LLLRAQGEDPIRRLVVLRSNATDVLLGLRGSHFHLPKVAVPGGQRFAEALSCTLRNRWNCHAVCLFDLDLSEETAGTPICEVMEAWDPEGTTTAGAQWISTKTLTAEKFLDPADYRMLHQALGQYAKSDLDSRYSPFSKPGWFGAVRAWVAENISPSRLQLCGKFYPMNASPSSCLIRFETTGPAVWFKAVGLSGLREYSATLLLQTLVPNFVPRVLAHRSQWIAWLALEAPGVALDSCRDLTDWRTAARSLGQLQVSSLAAADKFSQGCATDLRTSSLLELASPFFEAMKTFMAQQKKTSPAPLTGDEISTLGELVKEALMEAQGAAVPDGLGHLDLNPDNVIVSQERAVFLDWAEAYWGSPFLSFEYLLEHCRRRIGFDRAVESQLRATYLEPWRPLLSTRQAKRATQLAPLLSVFAYAASNARWIEPSHLQSQTLTAYFRSLTRRMALEAERWASRRGR